MLFTTHSSLAPLCRPQTHGQRLSIYGCGTPVKEEDCRVKWGRHLFSNSLTQPGKEGLKPGALGKDCPDLWRSDNAEESGGEARGKTMGKAFACLVKAGELGAHLKCLCISTSASIMVENQQESDVHTDSQRDVCEKPLGWWSWGEIAQDWHITQIQAF